MEFCVTDGIIFNLVACCLPFLLSTLSGVLEIQKIRTLNLSLGTKNGWGGAHEILRPSKRSVCLRELHKSFRTDINQISPEYSYLLYSFLLALQPWVSFAHLNN